MIHDTHRQDILSSLTGSPGSSVPGSDGLNPASLCAVVLDDDQQNSQKPSACIKGSYSVSTVHVSFPCSYFLGSLVPDLAHV